MQRRTKILLAGLAVAGSIGAGTTFAMAGGADDDATDTPIAGTDLDKASAAALDFTGEAVTQTEVGDEESLYEVEVTLDDGSQVDVQLDDSFAVVGSKADQEDDG